MRFIFYTYSDMGIITLDYDDVYTQKKTATPDTRFVTQLKSSVKATA